MLKFWYWDTKKQTYELSTAVESPHQDSVTGIAFDPSRQLVVTASLDRKFKIWDQIETPQGYSA